VQISIITDVNSAALLGGNMRQSLAKTLNTKKHCQPDGVTGKSTLTGEGLEAEISEYLVEHLQKLADFYFTGYFMWIFTNSIKINIININ
jgi:hypothetical protein